MPTLKQLLKHEISSLTPVSQNVNPGSLRFTHKSFAAGNWFQPFFMGVLTDWRREASVLCYFGTDSKNQAAQFLIEEWDDWELYTDTPKKKKLYLYAVGPSEGCGRWIIGPAFYENDFVFIEANPTLPNFQKLEWSMIEVDA